MPYDEKRFHFRKRAWSAVEEDWFAILFGYIGAECHFSAEDAFAGIPPLWRTS